MNHPPGKPEGPAAWVMLQHAASAESTEPLMQWLQIIRLLGLRHDARNSKQKIMSGYENFPKMVIIKSLKMKSERRLHYTSSLGRRDSS